MAVKQWPYGVPYEPLRDKFEMKERYAANKTHETEQGAPRQRPSASAVWSKLGYGILLTDDQARVIDKFILVDLLQGSARFMMQVGRFYDPAPWPNKLCMIENGQYKFEPFGDQLVLTFTLMVLDW